MRSSAAFLAVTCALAVLAGTGAQLRAQSPMTNAPADASAVPVDTDPGLADLIRSLDADESSIDRFFGLRWSETRFDRMARMWDDLEERLRAVDTASLGVQGRIDYILMRDSIAHGRAQLALQRRWLVEMDALLPFRRAIQDLEWARRRLDDVQPEAAAAAVAAIPGQVKAARAAIEEARKKKPDAPKDGPPNEQPAVAGAPAATAPSPTIALRAAGAIDGLRRTLTDWARFYEGYKPDFAWWLGTPRAEADKALEDYAKFLRQTVAGVKGEPDDPLIGDPIGEEALTADLRREFIAYSPAELIAIAEREFAWCEAQMRAATAQMGLGDDWKAALAQVKLAHVPPGEQDALVRTLARESVEWLNARDLVTIPPLCEETWRIEMLSPEAQRTLPFAVYGGQYIGVAYPTQAMAHDDKLMSMRGNNRHFTRCVVPHELIPGHHLQGYMASRHRPYRSSFSTPFLVEGWALHWEMLMYDAGWPQGPQDRIGMLFWRMHRCARIVVSLRFHLGQMTPDEMVTYLVERVGHERSTATGEVRRFIGGDYPPLYQCGYMIGGLQVRALHTDLVGGGSMSARQFHDAVLRQGPVPIELIRAALKDERLAPDATATWRFAKP